jgi:hypothetical protein
MFYKSLSQAKLRNVSTNIVTRRAPTSSDDGASQQIITASQGIQAVSMEFSI